MSEKMKPFMTTNDDDILDGKIYDVREESHLFIRGLVKHLQLGISAEVYERVKLIMEVDEDFSQQSEMIACMMTSLLNMVNDGPSKIQSRVDAVFGTMDREEEIDVGDWSSDLLSMVIDCVEHSVYTLVYAERLISLFGSNLHSNDMPTDVGVVNKSGIVAKVSEFADRLDASMKQVYLDRKLKETPSGDTGVN